MSKNVKIQISSVLLFAITAALLTSSLPYAAAVTDHNSPAISSSPSSFPAGGSTTLSIIADPGIVSPPTPSSGPHHVTDIRVYDPNNFPSFFAGCSPIPPSSATGPTGELPGVSGGNVWELRSFPGNVKVQVTVPLTSSMTIPFNTVPTFPLTAPSGGSIIPFSLLYTWVSIPSLAGANTNVVGDYVYAVCGRDGTLTDGSTSPIGQAMSAQKTFTVTAPVGGEIIPIDSVSLLAAGMFVNSAFTLPMIGAVAGFAALTLIKLRNKKQS